MHVGFYCQQLKIIVWRKTTNFFFENIHYKVVITLLRQKCVGVVCLSCYFIPLFFRFFSLSISPRYLCRGQLISAKEWLSFFPSFFVCFLSKVTFLWFLLVSLPYPSIDGVSFPSSLSSSTDQMMMQMNSRAPQISQVPQWAVIVENVHCFTKSSVSVGWGSLWPRPAKLDRLPDLLTDWPYFAVHFGTECENDNSLYFMHFFIELEC